MVEYEYLDVFDSICKIKKCPTVYSYILSLDLVGAHGDVGEAVVEVPEDCLLAHRALQGLQVGGGGTILHCVVVGTGTGR